MQRVVLISHVYIDPANRGKLRALAARGLEVTVGVPQSWREPALGRVVETTWERQQGVEVFPIPVRLPGDPERMRFGRRALGALLRDKRPDLLQVEAEPTTLAARQVVATARSLRIPAVLFTAETVARPLPLTVRWRRRRTLKRLRGVAAGSEAAATLLRAELPELPIAVVPQLGVAVPTTPEHFSHEGLAIGYVGRLVVEKGLDNLLQALALNRAARWHLTIVGDGPDRERLEARASELRLAARVRWAGALPPDAVARLWPDFDVLVLPSSRSPRFGEANAHALVEAMAHEVAVVGTDSGLIPEAIGDAGTIVPAGDAPALAQALVRLADAAVRRQFAQAARARAMRLYSEDAVAERTLEFWRDVVSRQ